MRINLLIILSLFFLSACQQQADHALLEEGDVILVTVDGQPITVPMLEVLMRVRGVDEGDHDGMRQLLDELIRIRAMANAATDAGLSAERQVRAERMIKDMEVQYVRYLERFQEENPVSDEDIEAAYQAQAARAGDRQFLIESILHADQASVLSDIARAEDQGLDFEALSSEALPRGMRVEEGVWVDRSQVPESFGETLAETGEGEIVAVPLQVGDEWRLVAVREIQPLEAPPLHEVYDGIRRTLARQHAQALIDTVYEGAEIVPMLPLEEISD